MNVRAQLAVTSSGVLRYRHSDNQVFLTPAGATNPGFKFYVGTAGTWTANFQLSSNPAPTVSQYDFTLWSVSGNSLNSYATQSLTSAGSLSFTIGATGYYLLTVGLTVSAIDSTTRYPIALDFSFADQVCPTGEFFDRTAGACASCSNDANSAGTTTVSGVCDCSTGYFWNRGTSVCEACSGTCPTAPTGNGTRPSDNGVAPTGNRSNNGNNIKTNINTNTNTNKSTDVKQFLQDFNNGNLRSQGGQNGGRR